MFQTLKAIDFHDFAVLVIGSEGFLGREVVGQLIRSGAVVYGVDVREASNPPYVYRQADLVDASSRSLVLSEFMQLECEKRAVVYMAGIGNVAYCEQNPADAYLKNVELPRVILKEGVQKGVSRYIFPSSALVYGGQYRRAVRETDRTIPLSVYARLKKELEEVVCQYCEDYRCYCDVVRIGNVYGRSLKVDSVLGEIVRQLGEGVDTIRIRTLKPVRDYIFIEDVAIGIAHLLYTQNEPGCDVVNLAYGKGVSVADLVALVEKMMGRKCRVVELEGDDTEIPYLVMDIDRLKRRTGWVPGVSLEEGLSLALGNRAESVIQ